VAETSAVTNLARTLRELLEAFPPDRALALVGGLAVSARTEPRFTRDLDFAIAVENDAEAESIVFGVEARRGIDRAHRAARVFARTRPGRGARRDPFARGRMSQPNQGRALG